MNYLHSIGIMHSDLKAANVLLKSAAVTQDDPRGFICKARLPLHARPLHVLLILSDCQRYHDHMGKQGCAGYLREGLAAVGARVPD